MSYFSTPANAIGNFIIGVSPIGVSPPPFDWTLTLISQYANSPILTQLLANFDEYIDQSQNMDLFFDRVWNVITAQGYGLDVWGRIVGVQRTLQVAVGKYFGFDEATTASADPFGQSPFYAGVAATQNYTLSDNAYRLLVLAKALANISDGSVRSLNQLLLNLFPGLGNCYVLDNGGMSMTYMFEFTLTPVQQAIVYQSGVLPKPVGVAANIIS